MAKRGDARVLQLLVMFFLNYSGLSQQALGERAGIDQGTISDYKLGLVSASEKNLRRLARAAGVPWPAVVHLRRFYAALLAAIDRRSDPSGPAGVALDAVRLAMAPFFLETGETPLEDALAEAREIWAALEPLPMPRRKRLLGLAPRASRSWALAVELCEASVRAAAHGAGEAQELAELAFSIAEQVPGEEGFRSRLLGWCRAFVANVLRVATDFDGAETAFAHAWELWRAGEGADPRGLLPEWRLLDLEASLRREQRRFSVARELLDRAKASSGDGTLATARILMNKSHVLEQLGDFAGALRALDEAAPAIETASEPRLLFGLLFNTAANLRHLGRYAEAAGFLPRVREMAVHLGDLHYIRVVWLTARVAAGLGRREEAEAGFEQVRREFESRDLPYEAALASLDLAVLWLEAGRTAEVRELAVEMERVFKEKKIAREALAAVILFCEAARREAATVELARRVIGEIEAARRGGGRG
ncbi:MAG TPA: helix-turn-helix transcriptional regulator, partial [Thermoanaerobaculia bacterium]|nr:helix-turn-helix transcriptional regulator [Thermoanaerobaculia bacterium]